MAIPLTEAKSRKAWKIWEKPTARLGTSTSRPFPTQLSTRKRSASSSILTWTRASSFLCGESSFRAIPRLATRIRREIVLEEGQVYNQQLWELSIQRLNQLGFFDTLKADDPNVTERHLDEKEGTVDLTLKVKEKGKNSIGLSGGVSGLSGSFI